jgi:hypothetical protein
MSDKFVGTFGCFQRLKRARDLAAAAVAQARAASGMTPLVLPALAHDLL